MRFPYSYSNVHRWSPAAGLTITHGWLRTPTPPPLPWLVEPQADAADRGWEQRTQQSRPPPLEQLHGSLCSPSSAHCLLVILTPWVALVTFSWLTSEWRGFLSAAGGGCRVRGVARSCQFPRTAVTAWIKIVERITKEGTCENTFQSYLVFSWSLFLGLSWKLDNLANLVTAAK